jgi:DNA polymerase elongation subunit (family B)
LIKNKRDKNKLILIIKMEHILRVFDYNVYNQQDSSRDNDEENVYRDTNAFMIQMFGVDEKGKTYSVNVEGFKPFFYVMVRDDWTIEMKEKFINHLKDKIGKYYANSITESKIIRRKKLYGFDNKKEHKFIFIEFANLNAFNKAKNLWYSDYQSGHILFKNGYNYLDTDIKLYEANIPPLLRFFHIKDISPSGWIAIPKKKVIERKNEFKNVNCDFDFTTNLKNIIPLNDKETRVPYKIMSFDIEASSSHGDFPVPIKTYKKLATNIVEYFENVGVDKYDKNSIKEVLTNIILTAFGYGNMIEIDLVYPKKQPSSKELVIELCNKWLDCKVRSLNKSDDFNQANSLESIFDRISKEFEKSYANDDDDDKSDNGDGEASGPTYNFHNKFVKEYSDKKATIIDILLDKKFDREGKLNELNISLNSIFPKLEGDKVTFIGSTFMNYGNKDPYFNHCIVLNTCSDIPMNNSVLESYKTEEEVLLAWQQLVQRENPDIIIGYNIFGFDYEFMFRRAEENNCVEEFLKLSRNKEEICGIKDKNTGKWKIEESSIQIASGQHDLRFIKMNGRLQVDLYNFYRRTENLTSYKLDYVAGNFIGDYAKKIENTENSSIISTTNLTGLLIGSYIHIEEIGHSVDYYEDGAKFIVTEIDKDNCKFKIDGIVNPDFNKKIRWCLAKDDVTPKDIFRMTNGNADDRSVIAKYCIQDCNLVHYLFNKSDILTGFIEMAKICSVPINFLVMRGQGIKLQSLIANECRKIRTLIPVIEKGDLDEGYEGAIVLPPKCDLYLDNPVACNDYASLYPSSMISENLSHDSKVWTKEFDLAGNLIEEWGYKDNEGNYMYDNLPDYEYVDVPYDTYRYYRKNPKAAAEKIKCGYKICRFAQFSDGESAIMPAILKKLLKARKDTRKMIPNQTDEFMKQVLEQRQLGYKVTANSLYGGCGAKTSSFYEKDIAACTTAMGRKLLTYGKRIIEECYSNKICETKKHGLVLTNAEYIYGDTDSVFYTFNLQTPDGQPIRGKDALEITIELAQEAGEIAAKFLKGPHDFEYEKTFMPFCLLSKKRYVGMLYETDPNKCKRKEMGIVLKRRDNAPIVKDVYGGIIDILMKMKSIPDAITFLKNCLQNVVDEKYPIDKLVITKSLRSGYKNPQGIAHKVLADRITARDPGNKPGPGDRIPFAYIVVPGKKVLQGDKIETPSFILENNLKIDYSFYITNQIMKPVQQLFALVLEKIWVMQGKRPKLLKYKKDVKALKEKYINDEDKFQEKLEEFRCKEIKTLLFDEYLRETNNEKAGLQSLTKYFVKK